MTHTSSILQFAEGGLIKEIYTKVAQLRKVGNHELLITDCGKTIDLRDVVSINGVNWGF